MLHVLNDIATTTINRTETNIQATKHFLNYAAWNPNYEIIYQVSDMIPQTYSGAAYLIASEAWIGSGSYHYFSSADCRYFNNIILVLVRII